MGDGAKPDGRPSMGGEASGCATAPGPPEPPKAPAILAKYTSG